jgi:hypothetical protein
MGFGGYKGIKGNSETLVVIMAVQVGLDIDLKKEWINLLKNVRKRVI